MESAWYSLVAQRKVCALTGGEREEGEASGSRRKQTTGSGRKGEKLYLNQILEGKGGKYY